MKTRTSAAVDALVTFGVCLLAFALLMAVSPEPHVARFMSSGDLAVAGVVCLVGAVIVRRR